MVIQVIEWYEQDRVKVKSAQDELDAFYRQDTIDDLNNAKDAELKVLDERINNWNKYLEMLDYQYGEFERKQNQLLLFEELGVTTEEELRKKITDDMNNFNIEYQTYSNQSLIEQQTFYDSYISNLNTFMKNYTSTLTQLEAAKAKELSLMSSNYAGSLTSQIATGSLTSQIATGSLTSQIANGNNSTTTEVPANTSNITTPTTPTTSVDGSGTKGYNASKLSTSAIQNALDLLSYDIGKSGVDGSYGKDTTAAVKKFQTDHGLTPDGIVGPKTEAALNKALDEESAYLKYSNGIENGPVTYTGLAMLHGTPSSPEYVLNSDQAYSLLRYMATNKPEFTSNSNCGGDTVYQFQGGITMNGVNDPEEFFNELMKATGNRFSVTKNRK